MKKNQTKLYNVILPIWLLVIFPFTWIIILPLNFLIDTLVLKLTMKCLKIEKRKEIYKMTIFKTWIFGFLADFIGAALLLIAPFCLSERVNDDSTFGIIVDKLSQIMINPFDNIYSIVITIIAVIITAYFIYLFNYKFALKKVFTEEYLEDKDMKKIALSMAVFTAPYVFFLPAIY
ncbi:hypothetical protein [Intestinibacter bartlettii]|uniref:hypothetical protein n=2 Tax=Intestinibacter bartlettii TaxID=261299 RepID=UPI001D00E7F7|nr:hypothetical protein [Intestinibacter bartlettii]MCB5747150.1 hypothetical protein [Intestinibacter bartlettii]MDU1253261.1 hypothetical protein [Peptostreptococcaceae bacterium]MDU2695182.1 hypothetical protein [Intestinibacter bartlettii]MDU6197629.1 hypothetical protein [Intestinibacter bartlettii]